MSVYVLPDVELTEVAPAGAIGAQAPANVAVFFGVAPSASNAPLFTPIPMGAQNTAGIEAELLCGPLCREWGYVAAKVPVQTVGMRLPITAVNAVTSTPVITANMSSNFTATPSGTPTDGLDVVIGFPTGGTTGSSGIMYTVSTDGGVTTGAPQALGTATSITVGGVSIALGSAHTVTSGDKITFWTQPASASILPTTVTRVASSTSTLVFSGTPNDGYEIIVQFPEGGTEGTPGITLKYSLDGGYSWSDETNLPLNGVFVIPDKLGSTGVTLTVGSGTIDALDQVAAKTTPPAFAFSDVQTGMNIIRNWMGTWSFKVLTSYGTRAMRDNVESLEQTYATNGRYTWTACPGRDLITGERTSSPNNESGDLAWSGRMVTEWGTSVGNRTPPMWGSERVTCPMTGRQNRRPVTLGLVARAISISPDRDLGDRTLPGDGALSADQKITAATGQLAEHDARINPVLQNLGGCVLRTYYGEEGILPGVYPAGGQLMSASGDIQYLAHRRVLNLADAAMFGAMGRQLLSRLGINPPTMKTPYAPGDLQPWDINNLTQQLFLAVKNAVSSYVSAGNLPNGKGGITVVITPTPGGTGGGAIVYASTQLTWKDLLVKFSGVIGFVNPAFQALNQPPS